jgi:hypothetical protein
MSTFSGTVPTSVEKSMNFWNSALCLSVRSPAMKYRTIGTVSTTSSGVSVFLARYLRASCGLSLTNAMAFFHTAAKRLATSGRPLMKSLVSAQPAANALPFSSPRMYLVITPASSVRATPSLRMVDACGSSV